MAGLNFGEQVTEQQGKTLTIDENAQPMQEVVESRTGIVVIENLAEASAVVAVNYANSVGASILIVDALAKNEGRSVQGWIQDWKEGNNLAELHRLKDAISRRIGSISFPQFDYATFFTEGLPYSLILENIIPCSYVNLSLRPDLFVLNSIMFENGQEFHAAVVFSPVFFPDEETNWLCHFLRRNNYYLRALVAGDATLANLDFHSQYFPYDLLHICSHGGEVNGYEMSERFVDRDGNTHVVEFDEVVGYTPIPDKPDMVAVHRKVFPRKLDGVLWRSAELEKQNIPDHVCHEMWKCMIECRGRRKPKGRIAMSCAIACTDSIHQGAFHVLACHSSPLVFNNTCWSSHEVASFFLACGARGYIGTLWAIDNRAAIIAARIFYENLFSGSVLSAFQKALKAIDATSSKDIYVYWGLHFTTLSTGQNVEESRGEVRKQLVLAGQAWLRKIESTRSSEVRRNSVKILKAILRELRASFSSPEAAALEIEAKKRVPELSVSGISRERDEPALTATSSPLDYREVKRQDRTDA